MTKTKLKPSAARVLWGWRCTLCTHVTLEHRRQRPAVCHNPKCDSATFDGYVPVYQQLAQRGIPPARVVHFAGVNCGSGNHDDETSDRSAVNCLRCQPLMRSKL